MFHIICIRFSWNHLKSHSFESFAVYAKVLPLFQPIFCAFSLKLLFSISYFFIRFFFACLISGVRYTNEIKSNGSVDRTNSDWIGFPINELYTTGTLTMMIISDFNPFTPIVYLNLTSVATNVAVSLVYFYDLSQMNSIEDKGEVSVMTSWLCANQWSGQSLDEGLDWVTGELGLSLKSVFIYKMIN